MCGIVGIVDLVKRPIDESLLDEMCQALAHRGPDDQGIYINGQVGLGQRRLSIIDLSTGKQPLCNEDQSVWISFNGEIYNYRELRDELKSRGHQFATNSDTETIVHAYEEYGEKCVDRLRGMFAFAIWDQKRRSLFLARDRVGKKPLFYFMANGQFVFASELQSLVKHPDLPREIDRTAIDDFLTFGYIPAPKTVYRNVYKLPPAHYLTIHADREITEVHPEQTQRYWTLNYSPKTNMSDDDALEGLREVLTEAVKLRMISDVPLGALLSGGIDSSLVVAIMSQLSSEPIKTFSIGFDDSQFNELPYARMVAERYGTDHHEMIVRPDALEVLPKLIRHYGEPYSDSSAIPSYYVTQMTREHVTVALNGDGGDESFAGYDRYLGSLVADWYRRIPKLARKGMIEPALSLIPNSLSRRSRLRQAKRFVKSAGLSRSRCYLQWVSVLRLEEKERIYNQQRRDDLGSYHVANWFDGLMDRYGKNAHLDTLLGTDVDSYLPYDLLVKMDIASMANSLEARSPLLDHHVMEFAAKLPTKFKLRGRNAKFLLKRLGDELLPPEVMYRRKMGFGVPVGNWMRNELKPLVNDTLLSPNAAIWEYVDRTVVTTMVADHDAHRQDYTYHLWGLLCLEMWHQEFG